MHLGDYLYEYGTGEFDGRRHGGPPARARRTRSLTLADYRQRHAQYKTDPDLQALHAALPWVITWDDHEVANDAWSGGAENHTPGTEGAWSDRGGRRPAGVPGVDAGAVRRGRRRSTGGCATAGSPSCPCWICAAYRSQQATGTAVDDPTRTIAGATQLRWLADGLAGSTAQWKLVGNPVMIARVDLGSLPAWLLGPLGKLLGIPQNGAVLNPDQWDGYNADRERLVDHLRGDRDPGRGLPHRRHPHLAGPTR